MLQAVQEMGFEMGFEGGQVSTVTNVFGVAAAMEEVLSPHISPI